MRFRRSPRPSASVPEVVFVVAPQNRGQILEGICGRLAARVDGATVIHEAGAPLPPARAYFFSHYLLLLDALDDPVVRRAKRIVWFTHPSYAPEQEREVARGLRTATHVIATCSMWERLLRDLGVRAARTRVVLGAADPDAFRSHARGSGSVGFCSRYQPRKSPTKMLQLVEAMPHRRFILLGSEWRSAPEFEALARLPNFEYVEVEYADYPKVYDRIDVFVSPSEIEGGPIPLVEAMMANAVPVATRTGFAPDLVRHGENGFLCEVDDPVDVFAELVDAAFDLDTDVRSTVEHLSWDAFAAELLHFVGVPTTVTT